MKNIILAILLISLCIPAFADINAELIQAAKAGNLTRVKQLVAQGANVNSTDAEWFTALMWAAQKGYTEIAIFLLQNGASVSSGTYGGYSVLMIAAKNGHKEIVKLLIQAGADVNSNDKWGTTALMEAVSNNHVDVVKIIAQAGARINEELHSVSDGGFTVLIWAAKKGYLDLVKFLIRLGADASYRSSNGYKAVDRASANGFDEIVRLLELTESEYRIGVINDDYLRVRQSPELEAEVLGQLMSLERVTIIMKSEHKMKIDNMEEYWYYVRYRDRNYGWVYGYFVDVKN